MPSDKPATNPEAQVAALFANYEPALAKLGKACRAKMRERLPGLNEIVYMYENQKALVIAYSPSAGGGGSDALCSIWLNPECARLYFTKGVLLSKSVPKSLLQGSGGTVRYVALDSAADIDRPEVEAVMAAALKLANVRLDPKAKGALILKAEEQKQRALRTKKAARPAAASRTTKTRR